MNTKEQVLEKIENQKLVTASLEIAFNKNPSKNTATPLAEARRVLEELKNDLWKINYDSGEVFNFIKKQMKDINPAIRF